MQPPQKYPQTYPQGHPLPSRAVSPSRPSPDGLPDLAALRGPLLRFARAQLLNITLAEDAVSETLLVAMQAQRTCPDRAQTTAWIYGILRHKLVDQLRLQGREIPSSDRLPDPDSRGLDWFVGSTWCGVTGVRPDPDQALGQRQFMALLHRCCDRLPYAQRQAFIRRELRCDEPADICRQLGVSEGHLWVLVHRARRQLQLMLSEQGFAPRGSRQFHRSAEAL